MKLSCLKHALLIFLALVALGFITPQAKAQIQTTSWDNSQSVGPEAGCPQHEDNLVDVFTDQLNLSTGLHSGSYQYTHNTRYCFFGGFGQECDGATDERLTAITIYDTNGNVIFTSAGANLISWSNI